MKKIFLIACYSSLTVMVVTGGLIQNAAADSASLGLGALVTENPYRGGQHRVFPAPLVHYDNDLFYIKGLEGGYYLWNDGDNQFSANLSYDPLHFDADDSDNKSMKQLDNRHSTMLGGFKLQSRGDWGIANASAGADLLDQSNGVNADLTYMYAVDLGQLQVTPGIGIKWESARQNRYYYGVSSAESMRSGLNRYRPGDGWSPYLQLGMDYSLTASWHAFFSGRYSRLSEEVTDSPMVDETWTGSLLGGISYNF